MNFYNLFSLFFLTLFLIEVTVKITLDLVNYKYQGKNKDTMPDCLTGFSDQEKLKENFSYFRDRFRYSSIEYVAGKLILLALLIFGFYPFIYVSFENFTSNTYLLALLFFGIGFLISTVTEIPFDLYHTFVIEKKHGFNKMTPGLWIADLFKGLIIQIIIGSIIIGALIFIIYTFPGLWHVMLWIFFIVFSLVLNIIYPEFIAPLFNKFIPLTDAELKIKVENLLNKAGFKSGGVFEMDASKRSGHSNAYFTGFGKTKKIVLFDTLIKNMTHEEIIAVLAHELGHFKKKHILIGFAGGAVFSLAALFIAYFLLNGTLLYDAFGFDGENVKNAKYIGLFIFSIIAGPVMYFVSPTTAIFSRKNEYEADKYAVDLTGESIHLKNALIKLNVDNKSTLFPHPAYEWFYYSHPSLLNRIKRL